jgi:glycosyltransferase involved in cell wall biosynthesis
VDLGRFSEGADGRLRRELGVPAGLPLIGNVAALADHKDHPTFIDAAARLTATGLDARFVVIGDGELRAELEARSRAAGLAGRLHFLGFRADVPRLLPELDLFLFTSKTEGLGSSVIDALACRVPVVATRAGGVPEIVEDGVSGLLAPVGDGAALAAAAARVLADAGLRERLVVAGAGRAQAFTVSAMAERTLALYRELLAQPVG